MQNLILLNSAFFLPASNFKLTENEHQIDSHWQNR